MADIVLANWLRSQNIDTITNAYNSAKNTLFPPRTCGSRCSRRLHSGRLCFGKGKKRRCVSHFMPEVHYIEVISAASAIPAGGQVIGLNSIAEGTDYTQRVGRQIAMKMLQLDLYLYPPTTPGVFDTFQAVVIIDKAGQGAVPAYGDIFDTTVAGPAQAFFNAKSNVNRFRIVKSFYGTVQNGSPDIPKLIRQKIKLPAGLARVTYGATGAVLPLTNALYLVIASRTNTGNLVSCAAFQILSRLSFIDL